MGAADVSPDVLDDLERTICILHHNWTNAVAQLGIRNNVSIEALASEKINSPAQREYLQQRLDASLTAAQQQLLAESRRQCSESRDRYRTLVGHEFDLSLCGQSDIERRGGKRGSKNGRRRVYSSRRTASRARTPRWSEPRTESWRS
jgi:hypothetical protein